MDLMMRRIRSSCKPKQSDTQKSTNFLNNGGQLLEELISFCNGRYDIPIRNFTALELAAATTNFAFSERVVTEGVVTVMFRGQLSQGLETLIKIWTPGGYFDRGEAFRDIVIAANMVRHRNVLRLIGCCHEFEHPAPVYEYVQGKLLSHLLLRKGDSNNVSLLSWRGRMKIARDIASVIVYLHTSFPTPVIYRDLKPSNVLIDQFEIAKLFDFRLCISLPPRKLYVEDVVLGTYGYADPEYMASGVVTQKSDVYSFGVVLLSLLTGKTAFWFNNEGEMFFLSKYAKDSADKHQYEQLIDPSILEEVRGVVGSEDLLRSVLDLSLRCTRDKGDDRPEMMVVAKELLRMEKGCR